MSQPQPPLDEQGEAHEALSSAVANYGQRILESPQMLGNVVTDLLPDLPREQSLLIAAAEAGVAADLSQHVRNQNLDPGTSVQLAAHMLADKKAIDAAASVWVTAEYARALGYAVPVSMPPSDPAATLPQIPMNVPPSPVSVPPSGLGAAPPSGPVSVPPSVPVSGPLYAPVSAPPSGPPAAPPPGPVSAPQPGPVSVPSSGPVSVPSSGPVAEPPPGLVSGPSAAGPSAPPYGGGGGGTAVGPWQGWGGPGVPGGPPTPPGGGKRRNRAIIAAAAAVACVLVVYVITAGATHTFPFAHTAMKPPAPTPSPTRPHTPTPSPSPTLAAGVADLKQLLPGDLGGTATQCQSIKPPYSWKMPGLVQALGCSDPDLPGGIVIAYQVDSSADFLTSWQNFDKWWNFDPSSAGNTCPPSGSNGEGTYGFYNSYFPSTDNQVVQCQWVGPKGDKPAYAWAYPTEDAFFLAVGAEGSAFPALDNWWTNHSLPAASPSPSAS